MKAYPHQCDSFDNNNNNNNNKIKAEDKNIAYKLILLVTVIEK